MRLQAYKYTIRYRPEIENVADILSRSPAQEASKKNPGEQHILEQNLLLLIDYRSRCSLVTSMKTVDSVNIVKSLEKTFPLFDYPAKITTDKGPQFKSSEFKTYL